MKTTFAVPTLLTLCAGVLLSQAPAQAAPSLRYGGSSIAIQEPLDEARDRELVDVLAKAKTQNGLNVTLRMADNATLARLCELAPGIGSLSVEGKLLTDISPLARLANLTRLEIDVNIADCSVLAGLTGLTRLSFSNAVATHVDFMKGMTALQSLSIRGRNITNLSGLPSLPGLRQASISTCADLTPLVAAMPALVDLDLQNAQVDDLSPLRGLRQLRRLSLYGCTLRDFSPLADIASLREVNYYASKGASFADLVKLQQVEVLKGGLTSLDDIGFVAGMPRLRKFDVFAESVRDYSPLTRTNIEEFQVWDMRAPVGDVAFVGQMKALRKMKFWSVEGCTNSAALRDMPSLEVMTVAGYNSRKGGEPFDCSGAVGWKNVKKVEFSEVNLVNTDALAASGALSDVSLSKVNQKAEPVSLAFLGTSGSVRSVTIRQSRVADFEAVARSTVLSAIRIEKAEGIASLAPLKGIASLKRVTVKKGEFPEEELQGFAPGVKVEQR